LPGDPDFTHSTRRVNYALRREEVRRAGLPSQSLEKESDVQTGAVELLRCWKGRWAETSVVLMVGGVFVAFLLGAVALVHDYSTPVVLALLLER